MSGKPCLPLCTDLLNLIRTYISNICICVITSAIVFDHLTVPTQKIVFTLTKISHKSIELTFLSRVPFPSLSKLFPYPTPVLHRMQILSRRSDECRNWFVSIAERKVLLWGVVFRYCVFPFKSWWFNIPINDFSSLNSFDFFL